MKTDVHGGRIDNTDEPTVHQIFAAAASEH